MAIITVFGKRSTHGTPVGDWVNWNSDTGQVERSRFDRNGVLNGKYRSCKPNHAKTVSGRFVDGKKEGIWTVVKPATIVCLAYRQGQLGGTLEHNRKTKAEHIRFLE